MTPGLSSGLINKGYKNIITFSYGKKEEIKYGKKDSRIFKSMALYRVYKL